LEQKIDPQERMNKKLLILKEVFSWFKL
jgi:hypothetical protein